MVSWVGDHDNSSEVVKVLLEGFFLGKLSLEGSLLGDIGSGGYANILHFLGNLFRRSYSHSVSSFIRVESLFSLRLDQSPKFLFFWKQLSTPR